jgi:c-di-GMP-binding flagellar brake protein YcgR
MDERRQYHRYLLFTEIDHQSVASHDEGRSHTKDISRGGLCITTEGAPLEKGTQYRLKFQLPFTEQEINTTARVMWHKKAGELFDNGLTFIDIDERSLDLIEEYSVGSVEQPEK